MTSNHILGLPRNNSAQGLSLPRRLYRWPPLGLKGERVGYLKTEIELKGLLTIECFYLSPENGTE